MGMGLFPNMFHHVFPFRMVNHVEIMLVFPNVIPNIMKGMESWLVVWLPFFYFPRNIGLLSSSQLTNSYFSEGFFPQPPTSHRCPFPHLFPIGWLINRGVVYPFNKR